MATPVIDAPAAAPASSGTRSRAPWTSVVAGLLLCVGSGLLAVASTRAHHPPLIWFAFVPAIVAQHRVLPRRWAALGFAVAIGVYYQGYFAPAVHSIGSSLPVYERVIGVWIGLLALPFVLRSKRFHERSSYRWFVITTPLGWATLDFVRTLLPTAAGATAGFVANGLYDHPAVIQPISVFTLHALNLLVLVVNYAVALLAIRLIDRRHTPQAGLTSWRSTRVQVGVVGLVLVGWLGLSLGMLHTAAPTVTVAAVQTTGHDATTLSDNIALTRQAAAQGAQLVVWHEGSVRVDPRTLGTFSGLARELHIYLVVGWAIQHDHDGVNESTVFTPQGDVLGTYGKMHPVTVLGEHSDVRNLFPVMDTPFGRLGTIICADLDYTNIAHRWGGMGVGLLAVPSNDLGIADHYTRISMRAAENRMSIVKADGGVDSAAVDPYGRIVNVVVVPHGGSALLVARLPVGSGRTFASRAGDWFGYVMALGVLGFLVCGLRVRRRVTAESPS